MLVVYIVATDPGEHLEVVLAVAVGEHAGGQLHQADAQRPHVRADVVVRPRRVRRVDALRLGGGGRTYLLYNLIKFCRLFSGLSKCKEVLFDSQIVFNSSKKVAIA